MNYALDFSVKVETEFLRLMEERAVAQKCTTEDIPLEVETELLEMARNEILSHAGGRLFSEGDVRIGEIILIIDSDTRVASFPDHCGSV